MRVLVVHGIACFYAWFCMNLRLCARLSKLQHKHKPPDINCFDLSNHEAELFICRRPVQNGTVAHVLDGNFMNINFAFACMVVVSFAIALMHT
ncbi:hypothetical protein [Pseudomonas sp. NPDC089569]|uniref:hypothetical protein n=1 Tax=Pseudomonas sp. NPDC089569 TaxID=3390722 RepID=UPI003D078E30